jgi:prepilin signal peptidase PulO-like enzyme (type II secretory pathway)
MAGLDEDFASHSALTLAHIIPALFFVLLSPFVVFSRFAHLRWPEQILFPLGAIVGLTAYAMSAFAVGGWIERSAVFFFNTLFLYSLVRAFWHRQRRQALLKRRWLLRSIAVLLGIATTRPVMGVFFATSAATHLAPSQFFGVAFWIGFSINTLVFEFWLRSADRRFQPQPAAVPLPGLAPQDHPGRGRGYSR